VADKWVKQERYCMCKHNTEEHLQHCCSGKAIGITYSVCMSVALVIQHAMCVHHMVIGGMYFSVLCFNIVSYMAWFSDKKFTEHKMYVMIFSTTLSEASLILRRIQWDFIINVHTSSCKVVIMLVTFLVNLEFSWHIFRKYWNIKFH